MTDDTKGGEWVLVPREPTEAQLNAARDWSIRVNGIGVGNDQATGCYQATLAAAPQFPPTQADAALVGELRTINLGVSAYRAGVAARAADRLTTLTAEVATLRQALARIPADAQQTAQALYDEMDARKASEAERDEMKRQRDGYRFHLTECEQIAGKALGYPWYKDDQANFPGATEADGVCIGEHVGDTIVAELAVAFQRLTDTNTILRRDLDAALAERDRLAGALQQIIKADGPIQGEMIGPLYMAGLAAGLRHQADTARQALTHAEGERG